MHVHIIVAVSIHAPARGATPGGFVQPGNRLCFDPRPRTGGDGHDHAVDCTSRVSIHAPARGATLTVAALTGTLSFDPRPRTGGDRTPLASRCWKPSFRSTPPHGGRLALNRIPPDRTRFRSTPPHGGRPAAIVHRSSHDIVSIHAPARGATTFSDEAAAEIMFRSTPPHGGRQPSS